ncbi:MAG: hypothetical protein WCR52_12670 [Bacteroidota bacterium]
MTTIKINEEIAEFLAAEMPSQLMAFRPSESTQNRYDLLVFKRKAGDLNEAEEAELACYFAIEHVFRLAKIRVGMGGG